MNAAWTVAMLWLLFGGTHLALSATPLRDGLVMRLGEQRFLLVYTLVAWATFAALVAYYATHQQAGAAGPALGGSPPWRYALAAATVLGVALAAAGLAGYLDSPMALLSSKNRLPAGIYRITRHPFFVGAALLGATHALLASRLVGTVFFAGFTLLALIGARHQDLKLARRKGRAYEDYVAATSMLPFVAIAQGRQAFTPSELPWLALAAGLLASALLWGLHGYLFSFGGAGIILGGVSGSAYFLIRRWRCGAEPGERRST